MRSRWERGSTITGDHNDQFWDSTYYTPETEGYISKYVYHTSATKNMFYILLLNYFERGENIQCCKYGVLLILER